MNQQQYHTFHIPVMGLAYTIDSPVKVARFGISSVISIVEDNLIEMMRRYYYPTLQEVYHPITAHQHDYRAKRITDYLNLVNRIVGEQVEKLRVSAFETGSEIVKYFEMLPDESKIKQMYKQMLHTDDQQEKARVESFLRTQIVPGSIDVNIMTKLDGNRLDTHGQIIEDGSDAVAALRGYANSNLTNSSIVFSAGLNPRLYNYLEKCDQFDADENGQFKKKVIIKVSDYRSALIQGKYLAKKGIWVSEFRIESGLNCGGHAFATDGFLLGPILEEFKDKKDQLVQSAHDLMVKALTQKGFPIPEKPLALKITAQGGVGTAEEHDFLLQYYKLDSIGWGSPFLLVPEATSVDKQTRELLINAKEKDLYLSHISPLGVPFNTLHGTTNEKFKQKRIAESKAGSSCPKRFLALSKELDAKGICTSSKQYQDIKLEELEIKKETLSAETYEKMKFSITEKACLCVGLANASYLENNIKIKGQEQGVIICPGPNMAYFDQEVSLSTMVQHIYGYTSVLRTMNRPNLFVKELKMYIDYLKNEIREASDEITSAQIKKWNVFKNNLMEGIGYYQQLFTTTSFFKNEKEEIQNQLEKYLSEVEALLIPEFVLA